MAFPGRQIRSISTPKISFEGANTTTSPNPISSPPPTNSKKRRFDETRSSFPDFDPDKMELIRAKGHMASLETKVSFLTRELQECKTFFEREKFEARQAKTTMESRVANLERELALVRDRERNANERATASERATHADRKKYESKLYQLGDEKRIAELSLGEKIDELLRKNLDVQTDLATERQRMAEVSSDCELFRSENEYLKGRNETMMEELASYAEQLCTAKATTQELQTQLRCFQDDCAIAMSMREKLLDYRHLQQENSNLKKQVDRFKTMSENTLLLKEQKMALEEQLARWQSFHDELSKENNELKVVISNSSAQAGRPTSFAEIDNLSRRCVTLQNEKFEFMQHLDQARQSVEELKHEISRLQQELSLKCEALQEASNESAKNSSSLQTSQIRADLLQLVGSDPVLHRELSAMDDSTPVSQVIEKVVQSKNVRIEQLETRLGVKLDYDKRKQRVLHFTANPLDMEHQKYCDRLEVVEEENKTLRARIGELEKFRDAHKANEINFMEDDDVTGRVSVRLREDKLEEEKQQLVEKLQRLEEEKQRQKQRMSEAHAQLTREYRETCTLLTGFQLKMKDGGLYVVQSTYEHSPEGFFVVQKGQGSELRLLENDYANQWTDFIDRYLMADHSIPAFLAAVTLNLHAKQCDSSMSTSSSQ